MGCEAGGATRIVGIAQRLAGASEAGSKHADAYAGSEASTIALAAEDLDRVAVLACGHVFHCDCAARWLALDKSCPFRCPGLDSGDDAVEQPAPSLPLGGDDAAEQPTPPLPIATPPAAGNNVVSL